VTRESSVRAPVGGYGLNMPSLVNCGGGVSKAAETKIAHQLQMMLG